jgi:hypothetical protein
MHTTINKYYVIMGAHTLGHWLVVPHSMYLYSALFAPPPLVERREGVCRMYCRRAGGRRSVVEDCVHLVLSTVPHTAALHGAT